MNPRFPLYIVSKGRAKSRLTSRALERMSVPYKIVVEEQEYEEYAAVIKPEKILVLDKRYQDEYDTCDELGDLKSKGPGAARNFVWDHAIAEGFDWHWVMDDNIRVFQRLNHNKYYTLTDGVGFYCMEEFCLRYTNVGMAGPQYFMFAPRKAKLPPFITNTRIYSCNLIRNDVPLRWRARYNEDTDLSLRMLKRGWCTIQFNAFLQDKQVTQSMGGGNTEEFYAKEGTKAKSEMQVKLHPDVSRIVWRFGRIHHYVDYRPYRRLKLIRKQNSEIPIGSNEFGMKIIKTGRKSRYATPKASKTRSITRNAVAGA